MNIKNLKIGDDKFELLWGEDVTHNVIYTTIRDLKREPGIINAVFICLANGGNWFFHQVMGDFLHTPLHVEYLRPHSYETETHIGLTVDGFDDMESVEGKVVYVFDDIIDTGITMEYVVRKLKEMGAADVRVCVLCMRESYTPSLTKSVKPWNSPLMINYTAWLMGCGMDHKGYGRNLGSIYKKI